MHVGRLIVVLSCVACANAKPVPGYEGCSFSPASSEHGSCSSTEAANRLKDHMLAKRWIGKLSSDVKNDPAYSSLDPAKMAGADGTEIWRFTGGDNCQLEETDESRMTRSMYEAALRAEQSNTAACKNAAAADSTIQCPPANVGPPPPGVHARVCRELDWTTDFGIRDSRIVSVKYQRLTDDRRF